MFSYVPRCLDKCIRQYSKRKKFKKLIDYKEIKPKLNMLVETLVNNDEQLSKCIYVAIKIIMTIVNVFLFIKNKHQVLCFNY